MSEGPGSGVTPRACNSYPHCARPRPLISHQLVQASHPFYLIDHDDQGIDFINVNVIMSISYSEIIFLAPTGALELLILGLCVY